MGQTLPKSQLEEMRGLGLINEEALVTKVLSYFKSTQSGTETLMVTISDRVESDLEIGTAGKVAVKASAIRGLTDLGVFNKSRIDSKEISFSHFPSKFDKGMMISFSNSDTNSNFESLIAEPVATAPEMSNDGTLDMDAQADAAQADIEARGIGVGAEMF